jgi:alpha-tubulin suppressor-like RCC1 family protein
MCVSVPVCLCASAPPPHTVDRHCPTRVHGLEGVHVSKVACGWRHSAAVADNGRVFSWGWSKYGQLGVGDQK